MNETDQTYSLECPANPHAALKAATGELLGGQGIEVSSIALHDSDFSDLGHLVIKIGNPYGRSEKEIAIFPSLETLADPQMFSATIASSSAKPTLIPPDDIWLYYGTSPILHLAEPADENSEKVLAEMKKNLAPRISEAARKWKDREGEMVRLNASVFSEQGRERYGIYSAEFRRNIWTGKLRIALTLGDKASERFLFVDSPVSVLESPVTFLASLADMIPVKAADFNQPLAEAAGDPEWDIDEDEIPYDRGWSILENSIRMFAGQPVDSEDYSNPVGMAIESFIRMQCSAPCFTLQDSFRRWRPLWGTPDFRPAEMDPWNYPLVIAFPQQLEYYVDHIYNHRQPRSHAIELRHLIDMYLRIKYRDPSGENYGGEVGFLRHPDLDVDVYMLPHPERIAWVERENFPGSESYLRSLFSRDQKMDVHSRWGKVSDNMKIYLV